MTEFSSLTPVELAVFAAGEPVIVLGNAFDEQTVADLIEAYLSANPPTAADATASVKGVVQLAGDLGGTAAAPTVPGLAGKANTSHTHVEGDVTGLTAALAAKAALTHSHAEADVTGLTAALAGKSPTGHTHTSANVTDFTEAVQDAVASLLAAGTNVTLNYNDAGNTLTVTASGGGSFDAEAARDALGVALVGVGNIAIAVNDALDTITISTTATVNSSDAALRDRSTHTGTQSADTLTDGTTNKAFLATERTKLTGIATGATANSSDATLLARANHTGTQTASTISDFTAAADARVVAGITGKLDTSAAPELIRDTIATALVAGTNVTITPNDVGDTITIDAAGGGGGGITTEDARDAVAAMLAVTGNATGTNNDAGDTYTINVPGNPLYIQSGTPTPTAPALWVKDLGSGAFSLHIVTP